LLRDFLAVQSGHKASTASLSFAYSSRTFK
jgi:hypothetical protein